MSQKVFSKFFGLNKPKNHFWKMKFRFSKIDFLVYLNQNFLKIVFETSSIVEMSPNCFFKSINAD